MKDSLVLDCVIHHGSLVDHLGCDLKLDIKSDATIGVNIQVYIFELKLVVKGSLLQSAWPV